MVCLLHNINVATTQEGDTTKPCMQHHFALAEEVIVALLNSQLIFAFQDVTQQSDCGLIALINSVMERILQKPAMIIQIFDYTSCISWSNIQLIFKALYTMSLH